MPVAAAVREVVQPRGTELGQFDEVAIRVAYGGDLGLLAELVRWVAQGNTTFAEPIDHAVQVEDHECQFDWARAISS